MHKLCPQPQTRLHTKCFTHPLLTHTLTQRGSLFLQKSIISCSTQRQTNDTLGWITRAAASNHHYTHSAATVDSHVGCWPPHKHIRIPSVCFKNCSKCFHAWTSEAHVSAGFHSDIHKFWTQRDSAVSLSASVLFNIFQLIVLVLFTSLFWFCLTALINPVCSRDPISDPDLV